MNIPAKVTVNRMILVMFMCLGFFTPLIFSHAIAESYEFPKMMFVYVLGITLITTWMISRILWRGPKLILPPREISAYMGVIILSVVFSSHPYTSVWGYYSRFNEGLISYLVYFGLYLVSLNFLDEKKKELLKDLICLGVLPVSLYGILQIFTIERVFSTLGQPNWLGAYLVFTLPLVLERVLNADKKHKKTFWIIVGSFGLVCLWFTHSLSGLVGLMAGSIFLGLKFKKKNLPKRSFLIAGMSVLILTVLVMITPSFLKNRIADSLVLSKNPEDYQISDPGLIRLGLWRGSLRMAFSSPKRILLGTGPETFPYEFPFFRDDVLNYSSEWDFILNKPHNYYLEILTESGLITLLLYFLIMLRSLQKKNVFIAAGLLGFYVTNVFGWPTVVTSLLFWLFL